MKKCIPPVKPWDSHVISLINSNYNYHKMKKIKSESIVRSENRIITEHAPEQQRDNKYAKWYITVFRHRFQYRRVPNGIPQLKDSIPYRLIISRITGISVSKKNPQNQLYLSMTGHFLNDNLDIIGEPFHYQTEQCLPSRNESKFDSPIVIYYHSKIDKNYDKLFLSFRMNVVEMRNHVVQNVHQIGLILIKNPLLEESNKIVPLLKDMSEIQFFTLPNQSKNKLLSSLSQASLAISIESMLELKKLTKFITENTIVSHQNPISGIHNTYLPYDAEDFVVSEQHSRQLTIKYFQVHIPEKFQEEVITYYKKLFDQKSCEVKNRKVVYGYHNQYMIVNPSIKKLELFQRQTIGNTKMLVYEAIKQSEVIKVTYFAENETTTSMFVIGLIFQINGKQLQVAFYLMNGQKSGQISEQMICGGGNGSLYQLIPINIQSKPTLILEINAEELHPPESRKDHFVSSKSIQRIDHHQINQNFSKEKERIRQQIEKERLQILKQKEELERLKTDAFIMHQNQFQRKFQQEKENLYRKQQMIENQYKQQVQRQIRQKFELEEKIREMNQKLRRAQDHSFPRIKIQSSRQGDSGNILGLRSRKDSSQQDEQLITGGLQRIDPGYIIEPQNAIATKKVRQIVGKGHKSNTQLLKTTTQQFNYASKITFTFSGILWYQNIDTPRTIYMIIRFFNFNEFQTDTLTYVGESQGYNQLVRLNNYTYGYQNKDPSYIFTVDPSDYTHPAIIQKDFANYLYQNQAIIDIFDGETHLYIGQINVKLNDLMRGSKTQVLIAKEYNLVKIRDKQTYGVMQILIKNQQQLCKQQISIKNQQRINDLKRKIISNAPIVIQPGKKVDVSDKPIQSLRNKASNLTRQQLRIQKFKQQKAGEKFTVSANGFHNLAEEQKSSLLAKIHDYKQQKMPQYLKSIYQGLLNEKIWLNAHFGKASTFPFSFTNHASTPASFKVAILETESLENELTLIKNIKQWRYLVNKNNYSEPKMYEVIGEDNSFYLNSGETLPLLFKYLSFKRHTKEEKMGQRRMINVTICKEDNNWIVGGFTLIVQMHQQIIHHSYILYEAGDQIVDLIVPVIYTQTEYSSNPKKLHIPHNLLAKAQWLNQYEIMLNIKTAPIMQKLKFNLLLYQDDYFTQLRQNWLIQVHSYEGICTNYRHDASTKFKITLPYETIPNQFFFPPNNNDLKLYSTFPSLVFAQNKIELENEALKRRGGHEIWCELIGSQNSRRCLQITCVSGENDLIYGWAVQIYPYAPRRN